MSTATMIEVGTAVRVKYGRGRPANATVIRVYANGDLKVEFTGRGVYSIDSNTVRVSAESVTVL